MCCTGHVSKRPLASKHGPHAAVPQDVEQAWRQGGSHGSGSASTPSAPAPCYHKPASAAAFGGRAVFDDSEQKNNAGMGCGTSVGPGVMHNPRGSGLATWPQPGTHPHHVLGGDSARQTCSCWRPAFQQCGLGTWRGHCPQPDACGAGVDYARSLEPLRQQEMQRLPSHEGKWMIVATSGAIVYCGSFCFFFVCT